MTTGLIEQKANGASLSQISGETLQKLVLGGDLSRLDEQQKLEYYVYRCKAANLDPATKPFDLLKLSGKEVLYATKECSSQISNRDHLSATVVSDGVVGDIYRVVARCTSPDGRSTDDMGCVSIKGLAGDALCNAMMKATTKAKRRAILTHAGLGMMDESEIETVPAAVKATVKSSAPLPTLEGEGMLAAPPVSGEQTAQAVDGNQEVPLIVPEKLDDGSEVLDVVIAGVNRKTGRGVCLKPADANGAPIGAEVWMNTFHKGCFDELASSVGRHRVIRTKKNGQWTNIEEVIG